MCRTIVVSHNVNRNRVFTFECLSLNVDIILEASLKSFMSCSLQSVHVIRIHLAELNNCVRTLEQVIITVCAKDLIEEGLSSMDIWSLIELPYWFKVIFCPKC